MCCAAFKSVTEYMQSSICSKRTNDRQCLPTLLLPPSPVPLAVRWPLFVFFLWDAVMYQLMVVSLNQLNRPATAGFMARLYIVQYGLSMFTISAWTTVALRLVY